MKPIILIFALMLPSLALAQNKHFFPNESFPTYLNSEEANMCGGLSIRTFSGSPTYSTGPMDDEQKHKSVADILLDYKLSQLEGMYEVLMMERNPDQEMVSAIEKAIERKKQEVQL